MIYCAVSWFSSTMRNVLKTEARYPVVFVFTEMCTTGLFYMVLTHKGKNYKIRGILSKRVFYGGKIQEHTERLTKACFPLGEILRAK